VEWPLFSISKIVNAINKCSSSSTQGSNYVSWKALVNNNKSIANIVNIANSCINLRYYSSHFKNLMSIIIPKSNKPSYNNPKTFQPIVLLNILGKLIKKVISSRLQVYSTTLNFIYPNQMEDIKQQLITDASIYLTHLIQVE